MQSVVQELERRGLDIPETRYRLVRDWFAESLVSEEHRKEILASLEAEVEAGERVPSLAKLIAKFTGTLKTDNAYRTEIRRRAERDPAELLHRANVVLDAAHEALSTAAEEKHRFVVVFDNLEKIDDRRQVEAAVLRRADELRQLRGHLVLFFSSFDQFAPGHVQASQVLDVVLMPMLPVRLRSDPYDTVQPEAVLALRALLGRRVDVDHVFRGAGECIREATIYSGGRFLDFLAVLRRGQLVVFSKLGDRRELLVAEALLALTLAGRGNPDEHGNEIFGLLRSALVAARAMKLPEAGQILRVLEQLGVSPNDVEAVLARLREAGGAPPTTPGKPVG